MTAKFMSNQNVTQRQVLSDVIPMDMPFRIFIEPSGFCNLHCVFCAAHSDSNGGGYNRHLKTAMMPFEMFEKVVEQIKAFPRPLKIIDFVGYGEPTMNKDIAKMIALAKRENIAEVLNLITNGTLLTPKLSDELAASGLDRMKISVEALREKDFWEIAKYKINLKEYVDNIRYFVSVKGDCELYIKVTDLAVKRKEDKEFFLNTYEQLADKIYIENVTPIWAEWDNDLLDRPDGQNSYGHNLKEKMVCTSPFKFMQVCADGTVLPCCADWLGKLDMGNVMTDTLYNIWHGEKWARLMEKMLLHKKNTFAPCNKCLLSENTDIDYVDGHEEEILTRLYAKRNLKSR